MKLYKELGFFGLLSCSGISVSSEFSLEEQIVIERGINHEIDIESISNLQARNDAGEQALLSIRNLYLYGQQNKRGCFNQNRLGDELIVKINRFMGPVREKGPLHNYNRLESVSNFSWFIPLAPSVISLAFGVIYPGYLSLPAGLVSGSVLCGLLLYLKGVDCEKKLNRRKIFESSGALYDVQCGYRYSQLDLLGILKKASEKDRTKKWQQEVLAKSSKKFVRRYSL